MRISVICIIFEFKLKIMEKELETVEGSTIPARELTSEEINREITLERFNEYHYEVGEDFLDQIGSVNNSRIALTFGGFAMAKHPHLSADILKATNVKDPYTQLVKEVYDEFYDDDIFYSDFADFLNLTGEAKKRVNKVLILTAEYYK